MRPEDWEELVRLYEGARSLPETEREAYLQRETASEEVRAEVRRLLAARAPSTHFLEPPSLVTPDALRDLGEFTLLEEIGRGGMGIVYRALQRPLARVVAVKVLPATFALSQRQIDRFEREARAVAKLSHPNIVQVYSVGEHDGMRYFAMEFVAGNNLAEELERLRTDLDASSDTRAHLPSSHASEYFASVAEAARQVADGLDHAHRSGLVHRDVKPSNLLLDPARRVKIVDFGLVRDEEQGSVSASQDLLGTPHYMSPEQALSQRNRVDRRTDVYSLGVVLYELLTLERPFEGKTSQEVIASVLHREPTHVRKLNSRVPRDLETICDKAMARERDDRYPTAGALRDDLARFLAHEAIEAKPPGTAQRVARWARRRRLPLIAAGLILIAAWTGMQVSRTLRERGEMQRLLALVTAHSAEGDLEGMPLSRVIDLRSRLRELTALLGGTSPDGSDVVGSLQAAFESLHATLRARGLADLAAARSPQLPDAVREEHRISGLLTLLRAASIFPEDDVLHDLATTQATWPTLSVEALDEDGNHIPARTYLRELDALGGAVSAQRLLGETPLQPTPILPGYYRVVVAFDGGGTREFARTFTATSAHETVIARRRLDESALTEGMVLFPACDYTFPVFACEQSFSGLSVHLDGFWMDVTEVSNLQYARFARATGRALPRSWRFASDVDTFLRDFGDRPVTDVTWRDACDYAAWCGKRLPTAAEWHRAAGGLEGRRLPYLADEAAPLRGNVLVLPLATRGEVDAWRQYLEYSRPVTSDPDARTPEGLYHLFGNVYEMTESMAATQATGGMFVVRSHDRWCYGGAWDAGALDEGMRTPLFQGVGPNDSATFIGFRCAKSESR